MTIGVELSNTCSAAAAVNSIKLLLTSLDCLRIPPIPLSGPTIAIETLNNYNSAALRQRAFGGGLSRARAVTTMPARLTALICK